MGCPSHLAMLKSAGLAEGMSWVKPANPARAASRIRPCPTSRVWVTVYRGNTIAAEQPFSSTCCKGARRQITPPGSQQARRTWARCVRWTRPPFRAACVSKWHECDRPLENDMTCSPGNKRLKAASLEEGSLTDFGQPDDLEQSCQLAPSMPLSGPEARTKFDLESARSFLNQQDLSAKARLTCWIRIVREQAYDGWTQQNQWILRQLETYGVIMSSTVAVVITAAHLLGAGDNPSPVLLGWFLGLSAGSVIGAVTVFRSRFKAAPRNVVITGSTRGLGKALAREFLRAGDNIIVTSRSPKVVEQTVEYLRTELVKWEEKKKVASKEDLYDWRRALDRRTSESDPGYLEKRVSGLACNMQHAGEVEELASFAKSHFSHVDLWVNNAGTNPGAKTLLDFTPEELSQVVSTNLLGSLLGSQAAIRIMGRQASGGHIFNMDGAGSGGNPTPLYAAYGATKCALRQMHATLLAETQTSKVGVHTASPGMVLTDLLLSGATLANKQAFNFICEQPETVARALVPSMRLIRGTNRAVNYLNPPRVVLAIALAWFRRGRWFDAEGRAVYAAEAERLRAWGEPKEKSPVSAAMELVPATALACLYSSSIICFYLIMDNLQATAGPSTGM